MKVIIRGLSGWDLDCSDKERYCPIRGWSWEKKGGSEWIITVTHRGKRGIARFIIKITAWKIDSRIKGGKWIDFKDALWTQFWYGIFVTKGINYDCGGSF